MNHQTQVELTRAVFQHLAAGSTDLGAAIYRNPVAHYTCADRLAREKVALFQRFPLLMALSCQLPAPGDYLTSESTGVPILLTRDQDHRVHAFLNVCRHRGARVARGAGQAENRFRCPYHGWTYDCAGRLVGVPDKRSFPGLEREHSGLVSLPVIEQDGLVWVRATTHDTSNGQEKININETLDGLADELRSFNIGSFHHYASRRLDRKMNWKLVIDTFLEPYHFNVLHVDSISPIFHSNLCLFHPFGRNLRVTYPRKSIDTLRELPESEWDLVYHSALIYVLFPNTVFVVQADHLEVWRVFPAEDRVDEAIVFLDFFVPESVRSDKAREHWERNLELVVRTVSDEDFPTGEEIQFGFSSGAQAHMTYGRNEPALAYFEKTVAEAVGG